MDCDWCSDEPVPQELIDIISNDMSTDSDSDDEDVVVQSLTDYIFNLSNEYSEDGD